MSIRSVASQRPVLTAVLCAGLQFALTFLILMAGKSLAPAQAYGKVKLLAFASTIILPLVLTQLLGMWREVGLGLDRMKPGGFFIWCLLPAAMFLSMGVHQRVPGSLGSDLLIQLLNAFGEELLFRGVIFVLLLGLPQWKAIAINGVLFGSMHLMHGYMDGNWPHAITWAVMSGIAGMMFAAARYRAGNLWLLVLLHMVLNLSSMYSNVEVAAGPVINLMIERGVKAVELALAVYVMVTATRPKAITR